MHENPAQRIYYESIMRLFPAGGKSERRGAGDVQLDEQRYIVGWAVPVAGRTDAGADRRLFRTRFGKELEMAMQWAAEVIAPVAILPGDWKPLPNYA